MEKNHVWRERDEKMEVKITGAYEPEPGIQFIFKPKMKSIGWKAEGPDGKLYGGYEKLDEISTETVIEAFGRLFEDAVKTMRMVETKAYVEEHSTD